MRGFSQSEYAKQLENQAVLQSAEEWNRLDTSARSQGLIEGSMTLCDTTTGFVHCHSRKNRHAKNADGSFCQGNPGSHIRNIGKG